MGRVATLEPSKDSKKNLWYVSLPPRLSSTGKRKREYFQSKERADNRARRLREAENHTAALVRKAGPSLIETAVVYEELFQIYGFSGLKEACSKFAELLDAEQRAVRFSKIVTNFEEDHASDWSKSTRTAWNWLRKHLKTLESQPLRVLDTAFWCKWTAEIADKEGWSPTTYNDVVKRISGIWRQAIKQGIETKNPLDGVRRRKKPKAAVAILKVSEARTIMETAWHHDRDMVPYFAVALFAGLRPDSELLNLRWEDINFQECWIRVNFGNKTDTKRFVHLEANLAEWLAPMKRPRGSIIPKNRVRRRRYILRGRYQSPLGTSEKDWNPIARWARDITRHSYGSYLEGKYKDRNLVKENMGHADFNTFNQYYRNARTPEQSAQYWDILPPTDLKSDQHSVA